MLSRRLVIILAGLILILGVGGMIYWSMPNLAEFAPTADAQNVPASADLRLVFSRPMQPDSVLERLEISPAYRGTYTWEGKTLIFTPDRP
jgi:hypothetical protein